MERLDRWFYQKDTLWVARNLLGKVLVHETKEGAAAGKIVETEAYIAPMDKACHAYGGKRTPRTDALYQEGGHAYVYLIYGMYCCLNIVTKTPEHPECVLIRALEPTDGIPLMAARRKTQKQSNLCSGPGKLCDALGIDRSCNRLDLCYSSLYLSPGDPPPKEDVLTTKRINIDYAEEAKDYPWRFLIKGNPHVSVKKIPQ